MCQKEKDYKDCVLSAPWRRALLETPPPGTRQYNGTMTTFLGDKNGKWVFLICRLYNLDVDQNPDQNPVYVHHFTLQYTFLHRWLPDMGTKLLQLLLYEAEAFKAKALTSASASWFKKIKASASASWFSKSFGFSFSLKAFGLWLQLHALKKSMLRLWLQLCASRKSKLWLQLRDSLKASASLRLRDPGLRTNVWCLHSLFPVSQRVHWICTAVCRKYTAVMSNNFHPILTSLCDILYWWQVFPLEPIG